MAGSFCSELGGDAQPAGDVARLGIGSGEITGWIAEDHRSAVLALRRCPGEVGKVAGGRHRGEVARVFQVLPRWRVVTGRYVPQCAEWHVVERAVWHDDQ